MQIYDAIKKDHQEVKALLTDLVALDDHDDRHFALIDQIRDALIPHSRAEEAVFYNSIRALDADSGKVMHAYKEHMEAEMHLRALQTKEKVNLNWKKTAQKLKEALDHHIEEEESQIFALGKKVLSDQDAEQIGLAFERLKPEIKKENFFGTTADMIKNLMPPRLSKVLEIREGKSAH